MNNSDQSLPFLCRFAQSLPQEPPLVLQYDAQRQVAKVLIEGEWVDTPDATAHLWVGSRVTRMERETTDDE
jgi:hypothetical protein